MNHDAAAIRCRLATPNDAPLLARLNQQLIADEGHRNRMSITELEARMRRWLESEYVAVLIEHAADEANTPPLGYALFRRDAEGIYLRQFFIAPEHRRCGLGKTAIAWLRRHAWRNTPRIRLDVLVHNAAAIAFWRAVGFTDYCLTMEATSASGS